MSGYIFLYTNKYLNIIIIFSTNRCSRINYERVFQPNEQFFLLQISVIIKIIELQEKSINIILKIHDRLIDGAAVEWKAGKAS